MKSLSVLLLLLISFNSQAHEITSDKINKKIAAMEKKYSIKFTVDSMPKTTWAIKYEFAQKQDYENLYDYLKLFDTTFSKYPLYFLKTSKLKEISFVKGLKYNINNNEQATPVVTDYPKNNLIIDFTIGNNNKTYQEHAIHLAFYQMLSHKLKRKLEEINSIWNDFNIAPNVYGSQGIYANTKPSYGINHTINGFISSYSLTGISQDKAEIFAALYTKDEYKKVTEWIKKDKILFNKVKYMKTILKKIEQLTTDDEISLNDINQFVSSMEKKYSIKFFIDTMPTTTWKIDFEFAHKEDYENLYNYLVMFDTEFSKYPLTFLKKSKLASIAFVKDLSIDMGNDVLQQRGAIPDYKKELLVYDFILGNYNKDYQKHVIHHEFYHMLEEQFNGNVRWKDPKWNSLNIKSNQYGTGGEFYRGKEQSLINHPQNGFISLYSLSAIEEDKAEIFAALFIKNDYKKLKTWAKKDKILNKKVKYIKRFLKRVDPSFTKKYWKKVQN